MNELNTDFWSERWQESKTGWDIGHASPGLIDYCKQLPNKDIKILIPGAGNAYEAAWLWEHGFQNVLVLDWAKEPLAEFQTKNPDFPSVQLICANFFDVDQKFDLVLEQTFYCALPPEMRDDYVKHMHKILNPGGKIAGLLFQFPLTDQGPPFGGSKEEYEKRFAPYFKLRILEIAHNSIPPRKGNELFILAEKREDQG
jgi:methyl halide transferase